MNIKENNLKISDWCGYKRYDFEILGTNAIIAEPKVATDGNKWIFRAEFFGAFPQVDLRMCEFGYYIVYINQQDKYGHDSALEVMHKFKMHLCEKYGFCEKTVMFGFSRGGLCTVNYAAKYPEDIAAIYLDAPVITTLSWPGGKGIKTASYPDQWLEFLDIYGITEAEALTFRGQPIDKVDALVSANIPVFVVVGCADTVVPYEENAKPFIKLYREKGGTIEVIEKADCDHHPHSLDDPTPVAEFILKYTDGR